MLGPSDATPSTNAARAGGAIRRVTWIGLAVNVLLAAAKLGAGALGRSQAVLADGVHSLTDLATDLAILIGVKYWTAPADHNHPHGHQRIETLITAGIGLSLAAVAVGIGVNAVRGLGGGSPPAPTPIALAAALVSIVSKEVLYRWTVSVGRRTRSSAVTANAWHHRSDALSSLPAAAAVGLSLADPRLVFVDAVGAVVVCVLILQAAWRIIAPAAAELTDHGAPSSVIEHLDRLARRVDGVLDVHDVRTRYTSTQLNIDLHIVVHGDMSVRDGHAIAEQVRRALVTDGPNVRDVVVHVDPAPAESH